MPAGFPGRSGQPTTPQPGAQPGAPGSGGVLGSGLTGWTASPSSGGLGGSSVGVPGGGGWGSGGLPPGALPGWDSAPITNPAAAVDAPVGAAPAPFEVPGGMDILNFLYTLFGWNNQPSWNAVPPSPDTTGSLSISNSPWGDFIAGIGGTATPSQAPPPGGSGSWDSSGPGWGVDLSQDIAMQLLYPSTTQLAPISRRRQIY